MTYLSDFDADKAAAVGRTAHAGLLVTDALQVIVEDQFCVGRNVVQSKQPDPSVSVYCPLLCLAVRLAGVVHEPRINTHLLVKERFYMKSSS